MRSGCGCLDLITEQIMETTHTQTVRRSQVAALLEEITKDPEQIFSCEAARRDDLHLRYPPVNDVEGSGHLAYDGDRSDVQTREFIRDGKTKTRRFDSFYDCCPNETDENGKIRSAFYGRADSKVILEAKGTFRKMLCKRKRNDAPMKHWTGPKPDAQRNYDPAAHDLFVAAGMYNDRAKTQPNGTGKRIGRYGQWRPWLQICLRTIRDIQNKGIKYLVVEDNPEDARLFVGV